MDIKEVLTKSVADILPNKKGLERLLKKRKIKLYFGIDPTSANLHLGNAVPLLKLKEFQDLGHDVIFLIGTFTAQIGDPSGHDRARKPLTLKQIKRNITDYKSQASKIINFSKAKLAFNHQWLSRLKFKDVIKLASNFSVQRMLERDLFQKRIEKKRAVWLSEFIYPLAQGYDSVFLNVDLEVGGTDQTFNMLVGRTLQRIYNKKEKYILTVPLLEGTDGRKMSKSLNNTINLKDSANDMYGKIMSIRDQLIPQYFELCTQLPLKEIKKIKKDLAEKRINPRDLKARLAQEIVSIYHGRERAREAVKEFDTVFKEKKLPAEIPEIKIKKRKIILLDLLLETKLVHSKSEAKRLILQKAVKINNQTQNKWKKIIEVKKETVIQVGKRKFIKLL